MKRRLALAVLILLVLGAVGALVGYRQLTQPYKGFSGGEVFVDVPAGTGVSAIGRRLIDAGVIRGSLAFRLALRLHGQGRTLKAGEYRFTGELPPGDVIEKLARGDVYLRPITFPEGQTLEEMARIFEAQGFGPAAAFLDAARDSSPIRELDPDAPDLEGYLFPETYRLPRAARARDLVSQMTARFASVYTPELRRDAASRNLTTRQVLTLASLIEKETARQEERFLVSAVYHNRLKIGMGLQCDPTVIYALQRAGKYDGNLTRADLQFDSPYNTYRYSGLPPGPIAAPGRLALEAAVKPADVPYIYFVSRNDGSHVFATTLDEHNRNVHEYQVQFFRNQGASKPRGSR